MFLESVNFKLGYVIIQISCHICKVSVYLYSNER